MLEAVIQKSPVRRNHSEVASQAQSSFGSSQSGAIGHQFCAQKSPVGALDVAWASQIFGTVVALFFGSIGSRHFGCNHHYFKLPACWNFVLGEIIGEIIGEVLEVHTRVSRNPQEVKERQLQV